ncbi:MAG: MATE family efflux transporter [Clostridiales bacterium]|nr:MATE family efflux transporter [Clostridiales bacterium]
MFCTAATVIALVVFCFFGDALILRFFDNEANQGLDMAVVLRYAREYLDIILVGIFPFALIQAYAGTLRENGETFVPMLAGAVAIAFNMTFNWLLIFGKCGFPTLGVRGAAIATTASRFIELAVIVLYTHRKSDSFQFIRGAYRSMHIPARLVRDIAVTGSPLMVNEVLWSLAMTVVTGCYAARGMNAVAAANITTTVWNLFCIIMFAMGTAISIIVGRELGCGNRERAIDLDRKLLFADFVIHVVMGALLIAFSGLIPELYNTEPEVRATAARMLMFGGLALPFESLVHAAYFTIRSGGKTWTTFAFDCGFSWVVTVPVAFALCTFTTVPVEYIYLAVRTADILKLCIAFYLLKKGSWANTIIPSAE